VEEEIKISKKIDFGVVIPHHDRDDLLKECISSIPKGIFYLVTSKGTFSENNNRGFKKLREAGVKKVMFLNDDVIINKECWNEMMQLSKTFDIVGARTIFLDGKPENFGGEIVYKYDWRDWVCFHTFEDNNRWIVPCGACFIISSDVFEKCGMFNESYKNSCEDTELFLTAREMGYSIVQTKSTMVHRTGQSAGRYDQDHPNAVLLSQRFSLERVKSIVEKVRLGRLKLRKVTKSEKVLIDRMLA